MKGYNAMSNKYNDYFWGGGKIPSEIKSQSKLPKNLIHDHAKGKQFLLFTVFGILIGTTPVAANVKDNLSGQFMHLLGSKEAITNASDYTNASANAKINYLEKRIENLQNKTEVLKQIIDAK